jgi:hypothetical protein
MKRTISILAVAALAVAFCTMRAESQAKGATSIDKLKPLVGEWTATMPTGESFVNKIRLVSNGTALEESFEGSGHDQMVTMYTPDGNKVELTHYCSMGNQPRMETPVVSQDTAIFDFSFTGATNMSSAAEAHMHHMVLRVADNDHFSESWTMQANGKQQVETFQFTRKKA